IAPEQRRSLRYNSPELDEYASFVERRNGLPEGLIKAIKNAGERSNSNQVSPKGAQGVMQFIPGTWKQYGKDADPSDPVASIDAAGAYFKDLLQRYNGNVDAAVTEYNGGVKQAQTVAGGGSPWVPETVAYLARIRQALGQNDQGQPQRKPVPVMADPSIQPSRNLGEEEREEARRRREYEEQGAFTRGLGVVVPQMKQAAGAGLALFGSKTGNKELQQSGLDIYQNASKEAEKFDDPSASLSNVLDGKGSFSDFSKYWAGYGIGQVVESAITGLASAAVGGAAGSVVPGAGTAAGTVSGFVGGIIGKGAVKKALVQGAEKLLAKEVQAGIARGLTREAAEAAAAPVVKTWVAAETKKAGVRALAAAGAATGLYAQNTGMELGEIYGHYIDEMVRSGRPITPEDEDLALKSAMSAAGVETVADALGLGRLLGTAKDAATKKKKSPARSRAPGTAKDAATKGFVRNVAKEVALGVGREVPTEVAQTAVERFGKNQPLDNAEAMRDYVDAAGGAAVPGTLFGASAGVKRTLSPNSPLSNAATAAGGMAGPTVQPTPATPGAPSSGAAGATSPGQGAQAPADPISEKVEALRPFLEDKELVRAIRNLPELGPESVNELLAAWALARNPNTNPNVRASLLDQIGQFVDSVQNRPNWTFGKQAQPETGQEGAPNVPTVPGQSQSPRAVEAPRLTDDGLTLDGEARELPPAQLNAPTKPALETEGALRDRAQAMAEYEQAFQDLVKAEQLGASDAELQQKQQDLREAEAFKKQAEARLQEIRETIEGNRRMETERKRNAVLDAVLADAETANPAERFAAELKRQGFSETIPTPGELARIARFEDIKAAEREPQQAPDALPSAPNEFDPYEQRKERQNVSKKPGATNAAVGEKRAQGGRDVAPRGASPARVPPADGGNGRAVPSPAGMGAPVVRAAQPVRDA
ncbi:MAG TPA: transglycosylase SLT domain-containing protein, partial [Rhodanobacteraceae bacterium]|nr:transglycosylase SLT domain-containing protein [Rhodanobacteraceae bacterium]